MKRLSSIQKTANKIYRNYIPPKDLTVSEWAQQYRVLSRESSAEAGRWRNERTPYLVKIMDAFTDYRVKKISIMSASQMGKALSVDTPIPVPSGWKTMGELEVGDVVFDENGEICNVTAVTGIMYDRKSYKIEFSDGSEIIADACHKWYVESDTVINYPDKTNRKGNRNGVITTEEIAKDYQYVLSDNKKRNRYAIPVNKPLKTKKACFLLPPYTFGVWLGDGNSCSPQITTGKQDFEIIENIKKEGVYVIVRDRGNLYNVAIMPKPDIRKERFCIRGHDMNLLGRTKKGLCAECSRQRSMHFQYGKKMDPIINRQITGHAILRKLEVLNNKHIPAEYLRGSFEQRLALLQGIMDADGSVNKCGHCEITLKSRQLIHDVSELLHTLGIKHTIKKKVAVCTNSKNGKKEVEVYRISFMAYDDIPVFKLRRKLNRMASRNSTGRRGKPRRITETERRRIVKVTEVESVPVKCISVDSPSKLYLAGKAMIPTHNSELEMNVIGYIIDQDPGSILFIQPTIDDAKKFSRQRIAPLIRDCKTLSSKVADVKSRDSGNTMLQKAFPGGLLTLVGSNSASGLASIPAKYVIGDERDRWAESAGTEGDPWKLAEARTTTFYNAKMVDVSTPTIKGRSQIEKSYNLGTRETWQHQCPHCGEYHMIDFDNIKFDHEVVKHGKKRDYVITSEIMYACPACGCLSSEEDMRRQPAKWVAENPDAIQNGHRSFWLNGFSSPWQPWRQLVQDWLESKDDLQRMQVFYNTKLGKLWEHRGELADEDEFLARRENYGTRDDGTPIDLPDGVLVLTCGVDTQGDRLEYEVVGYGQYKESWGIKKGIVMGDPAEDEVWERLDDVVDKVYRFKDPSKGLKISLTFVDSGGNKTQDVYLQCAKRKGKRVFAIKGKSRNGAAAESIPYTAPPSQVKIKAKNRQVIGKTWLYTIGVNAGKSAIMDALKVQEPGPKYCHFPLEADRGYDERYFNGLLSEAEVPKTTNGRTYWAWEIIPGHERNEPLDVRNYANAAFRVLDPDMDAVERRLRETAKKKQPQQQQKRKRKTSQSEMMSGGW